MYQGISKFLPDVSLGARNYEIRNPRLQLPVHIHEYITGTCRSYLTVLLNEINSIVEPLDLLKSVVNYVQNVTLFGLKRAIKSYLLQKHSYYCVIPNCYVCQHYPFFYFLLFSFFIYFLFFYLLQIIKSSMIVKKRITLFDKKITTQKKSKLAHLRLRSKSNRL